MKQRAFITFLFVLFLFTTHAQTDTIHRFYGGVQIGGQNLFSLFHETEFFPKSKVKLHTNLTVGINNSGKSQTDAKERGIYGIQVGILGLIGRKALVAEIGLIPSLYAYKVAFVNLNAWAGLRLNIQTSEKIFLSLGYTPRLYTTYSDPDNKFFNGFIGLKFGVNF